MVNELEIKRLHDLGRPQKEIARELGISQGQVSKTLRKMHIITYSKHKNIDQNIPGTVNIPTPAIGLDTSTSSSNPSEAVVSHLQATSADESNMQATVAATPNKLRLHHFIRTIALAGNVQAAVQESLGSEERSEPAQAGERSDNLVLEGGHPIPDFHQQIFDSEGFKIRLITNSKIQVEGIQLKSDLGTPAPELLLFAERFADGIARHWADEKRVALDFTQTSVNLVEVGITEHDMAKSIKEKGIVAFYWNPITGKVEVWADKSLNLDELEANQIPHIEKLRVVTKDIVEDKWNTREQLRFNQQQLDKTEKMLQNQEKVFQTQESQLQWFQHHDALTVKLTEQSDAQTKLINQLVAERLEKAIQTPSGKTGVIERLMKWFKGR